jgi:hypothetical protein
VLVRPWVESRRDPLRPVKNTPHAFPCLLLHCIPCPLAATKLATESAGSCAVEGRVRLMACLPAPSRCSASSRPNWKRLTRPLRRAADTHGKS